MRTTFAIFLICVIPLLSKQSDVNAANEDSLRVFKIPSITVSTNKISDNSPVPISEITQSDIQNIYSAQDLPQILSELPSVITYSENGNGIGYTNLSLRGFDQRRIAVMVNGIPQNDPEDHNFYWINLSDFATTVDNIQVQRGAGMSVYGPAAIAGSINLSTINYLNFRGINISSGIGFQQFGGNGTTEQISSRFAVEYSSGLIDNYAFYAKFGRINSFGYRNQSWAVLNNYFFSAIRTDGELSNQLNFYGGWQNDGLAYNGLPSQYINNNELRLQNYNYFNYKDDGETLDYISKRRAQELESFSQPILELLSDWKIDDKYNFKSSLFMKIGEGYFDYVGTGWTNAESFRLTPENGFVDAKDPQNPIIRAYVANKTFGWIPKVEIINSLGNLLIGAEIRIHRSVHWGKINFAEDLPANYDPDYQFYSYDGSRDIISLFGGQTFFITNTFSLNLDAQFVYHNYNINNEKSGNNFTSYKTIDGNTVGNGGDLYNIKYFFINPRFGGSLMLDDMQKLYLSIAYTSREPRSNNLYSASDSWNGARPLFANKSLEDSTIQYDFNNPLVKPEKMLNIEFGWAFTSDKLKANVNFYLMDYNDELVKSGQLDIFGAPIDGNAPKTRHIGVELIASTSIFSSSRFGNLNLSGNLTYSINKIIDFNYATSNGELISLNENNISGFPDIISNLRLGYSIGNLLTSLYFRYSGEFRTDNFGDLILTNVSLKEDLGSEYYKDNIVDSYAIMNADLSYSIYDVFSLNKLKIHFQINNLTNVLYAASGFGKEYFPAAERNYWLGIELGL